LAAGLIVLLSIRVMIDLHLHLLPGVDDGPASLDAALDLARACVASGVDTVVATPHIDDWTRALLPDTAAVAACVAHLRDALAAAAIPLRVLAGGEAFLTPDLPRKVRAGATPTLAGTRWLLVETPAHQAPIYLEQVLFELQAMGVTPLLAHPERYGWLHQNPALLAELVAKGVRAQVTAASLVGRHGTRQRALAETFVRRGFVQVVATDRHGADGRSSLRDGYDAIVALVGEEHARYLVDTNPALILADKEIPVAIADDGEAGRNGRGGRWLGRLWGR
jgi:protein-tyrosine phosphatase